MAGHARVLLQRLALASLLILLVSPLSSAFAGSEGTILGKVLDFDSREPLFRVSVELVGLGHKTFSDTDGRFSFSSLPSGSYTIAFSAEGYESLSMRNIFLAQGANKSLEIALIRSLPKIEEEVTVLAETLPLVEEKTGSVIRMESEQITRVPGSFQDLSRVLDAVPGAYRRTQKSNDLIVRGGSPWENGFFIDNIQVPNINHFQSQATSGGAIGVIDLSLIRDLDFHTGGFSASYGNRMSSVVDIRFREGNRDRMAARLDLNITGFGARLEGPLGKNKGTWLVSMKRSYHDLVAGMVGYGVAPRFGDFHLKMTYDIDSSNRLILLNIFGDSGISYDLERAVEQGFNNVLDFKTRQNTIGLNWAHSWGDRGVSNTSLSYSFFDVGYSGRAVNPETAAREYRLTEELHGEVNFRNINSFRLGSLARMEFGGEVRWEGLDYSNYASEYMNRWGTSVSPALVNGRLSAVTPAAFATLIYNPLKAVTASIGLRAEYFSYNRHWFLSPRITTTWRLSPRLSIKAAGGLYYQTLPLYLLSGSTQNRSNADPRAGHVILGLQFDLTRDIVFSLDAFNKSYHHLPLAPEDPTLFVLDSGLDFGYFRSYNQLLDGGISYCRGIELLVQKRVMDGLYGLASVSFFRSRFRDYYGVWRNRINDNRYLVTLVGGYRPNSRWGLNVRLDVAGGIPYTPYELELSSLYNRGILDTDLIFLARYPSYVALNFRVERRFHLGGSYLDVYLGAINLLNRKNVDRYYWDKIDNTIAIIHQVPILPVFGVTWNF